MSEVVSIVGAGPAGLTAAIVLAKHGYKARVYEISPDVGHRMKGDFQGLENWSSGENITALLKDIGIDINFLCVPYYGGTIYAPEISPMEIKSDRPIFFLVKRGAVAGSLDAGLKEQALLLGVEILFNSHLGAAEGKVIVGTGPKRADIIAIGITFDTQAKDRAAVVFNDMVAPKGYAYLLVNEGRGTMATVLYRDYRNGEKYFERTLKFFKKNVELNIENEKRFGNYGNFFIRDTQIYHKKIYIGESAGFQDCLWGLGMRYAIVSGYMAAMSIITGSDYDALWKKELKPMLETSLINRYLYEKLGHTGYRYMAKKFAEGDSCGFLKRNYNRSFFKHLLLPLAKRKYERKFIVFSEELNFIKTV